jgi:hypothetical protein
MMLDWALGLFIAFIVLSISAGLAEQLLVAQMVDQINHKKANEQRVVWPPDLSWSSFRNGATFWSVWKEYRGLYPGGTLSNLLVASICLLLLSWVGAVYLLFAVLSAWAPPSR